MVSNLKGENLKNLFFGHFFITVSSALVLFFLSYFLKEKGLTILQIGFLLSIGLALGSLILGLVYSKILKKISLRFGLILSTLTESFQNLFLFAFPTSFGAFGSKFSSQFGSGMYAISEDVSIQHNLDKKNHRKISSSFLGIDSIGQSVGILIAIFLIIYLGFVYSFFIFFVISLIPLLFYVRITDKTRFKRKKKMKIPSLSKYLKLYILSEVIYWLALSSSFDLVVTFLVTGRLSASFEWIGYLFIGLYISIAITTFLTEKFLSKKEYTKTSILGMAILFLSALIIIFSVNLWVILGAFILEGVGAGIWVPSKTAFVWKLTQKENRENVSGYVFSLTGFVNAVGPLVGGILVSVGGILLPFYFKAILSIIVIAIYSYILIKTKDMKNISD